MARISAAIEDIKAGLTALQTALGDLSACAKLVDGAQLGTMAIDLREVIDRSEAASAEVIRHFDNSRAWARDGALSVESWLRSRCKLSGGAAAERVGIARQLEKLPQTQQAFAAGQIGYQHAAVIARTVEHVGIAAVRREERALLAEAQTHDGGQFVSVAKDLEHRVDREAALREANHAYKRRYLHISEPDAGMVRLDGILDLEGGAVLKTALDTLMPPPAKGDDRTTGQRRADALIDLARRPLDGTKLGSTGGQRPHLVITASAETLAGLPGAPAARLEGVGPIPIEMAQRFACDASISEAAGRAALSRVTARPPHAARASIRAHPCIWREGAASGWTAAIAR